MCLSAPGHPAVCFSHTPASRFIQIAARILGVCTVFSLSIFVQLHFKRLLGDRNKASDWPFCDHVTNPRPMTFQLWRKRCNALWNENRTAFHFKLRVLNGGAMNWWWHCKQRIITNTKFSSIRFIVLIIKTKRTSVDKRHIYRKSLKFYLYPLWWHAEVLNDVSNENPYLTFCVERSLSCVVGEPSLSYNINQSI